MGLPGLTRRGLFRLLLAAPLAPYLPGLVPAAPLHTPLSLEALNQVTMREILPGLRDAFFRAEPMLAYLRSTGTVRHRGPGWQPPVKSFQATFRWDADRDTYLGDT